MPAGVQCWVESALIGSDAYGRVTGAIPGGNATTLALSFIYENPTDTV